MFVHHISFFLLFHIEFWYHPSLLPEICVTFLAAITFETCLADVEVPAACIILIGLFALQHYGTHRVGFLFAPVIITWLFCLSTIGIYNIFYWNLHVYKALSPYYAFQLLRKTQKGGWMALGGILLCITGWSVCLMINLDVMPIWCQYSYRFNCTFTGSEAMFADLGHFTQLSIKVCYFKFCLIWYKISEST